MEERGLGFPILARASALAVLDLVLVLETVRAAAQGGSDPRDPTRYGWMPCVGAPRS